MIRGINRQIIDVQDTGSTYYERAYLVVKPEFASAERELLEKEARKVLKNMEHPLPGMKRANTKLAWFIRLPRYRRPGCWNHGNFRIRFFESLPHPSILPKISSYENQINFTFLLPFLCFLCYNM